MAVYGETSKPAVPLTGNVTVPSGAVVNSGTGAIVTPPPIKPIPPSTAPSTDITATEIGTTKPITLPDAPQTTTPDISTLPLDTQAQNYAAGQFTSQPTAKEAEVAKNQSMLLKLWETMTGKPAAQLAAENAQGIPEYSKQLNDINGQIRLFQAEALRSQELANRSGDTTSFGEAKGAFTARDNAIHAIELSSLAQNMQGNIALAQQLADRATNEQFAPVQAQIDYLTKALDVNYQDLSREDKKKADQQQIALAERQRLLDQQKAEKNDIRQIALEQAKNGDTAGASKTLQSKTFEEALKNAGKSVSLSTVADLEYKRAQTAKMLQDIKDAQNKSTPTTLVQGSKDFKLAQDLAYGDLTFQQFNSLYGRAASNAGLKTAIYEKASELNPNFSPANFELGFKVAANPKIRQQIASLDNVQAVIPQLISESEKASRTKIPLLNKYIIKGGIQLGSKTYSNFSQAQIAFADELSGALGFGSATDMSREMGFNLTNTSLSPEQFSSAIKDVVVPFIASKRSSLTNQMGVYQNFVQNPQAGNQQSANTGGGYKPLDLSTFNFKF